MMVTRSFLLFVMTVLFVACGGSRDAGRPGPGATGGGANGTPPAGPAHAAATAEDWCGEHSVPESKCTLCHPELEEEFRSAGDWCAEHRLPESVCPICHPEVVPVERRAPVAAAGSTETDEGPRDRLPVRLRSEEAGRLAGIESVAAVEREWRGVLVAPARVVDDPSRLARVNAPSPGVIRRVAVELGASVRRGDLLAEVESAGVGSDRGRLAAAEARLAAAAAERKRQDALVAAGLAAERDRLAAMEGEAAAKGELDAARGGLGVVGGEAREGATWTLRAPMDGIVAVREATLGRFVDEEEILFEIVDPRVALVEIDVPERELSRLRPGVGVTLRWAGEVGERTGRIESVAPRVDPRTRTAVARLRLPNKDGALRPGLLLEAELAAGPSRRVVVVPRESVQRVKGVFVAFVRTDATGFETRRVETTGERGGFVAVTSGLAAGEEVVTTGAWLLATETLPDAIGAGCCEVEPAGKKGTGR